MFAVSEMAVVLRESHDLRSGQQRWRASKRGVRHCDTPNWFLSDVQIGVLLIGILAGVFGGRTVAD